MSQEVHPKQILHKYEGILELYFETGMECMGTIFHDNRGNSEGPHWDTTNHPNETMTYRSLSWAIWFGDPLIKYNIRIFNKRNRLVYEGTLTKDRAKMKMERYRYSFLPKELTTKEWLRFCSKEYRAELWTNQLTEAIKQEYNIEHDVGRVIHDDLTGRDVTLLNVTLGENKTVGYWVNSDHLEGGRHPWEISKIDLIARWKAENEKEKLEKEKAKNEN